MKRLMRSQFLSLSNNLRVPLKTSVYASETRASVLEIESSFSIIGNVHCRIKLLKTEQKTNCECGAPEETDLSYSKKASGMPIKALIDEEIVGCINLPRDNSQSFRKLAVNSYSLPSREHMCSLLKKLTESTYAEKDEYCAQPTQIIILKPSLVKAWKAERTIPLANSLNSFQYSPPNNLKFPVHEIMELCNEERACQNLHHTADITERKTKGSKEISKEASKRMNTSVSKRNKVSIANLNDYGNIASKHICSDAHQNLALEAARDGIVLLKNLKQIFPLSKSKVSSLGAIGPHAIRRWCCVSCFSSHGDFLAVSSDDENEEVKAGELKEFNRVFITYSSKRDEKCYGFGEQFSHMEFKGRRVPILVQEQGIGRGDQLKDHDVPVSAFWLQDWVGKRKIIMGSQLWWNWEGDTTHYVGWRELVDDFRSNNIRVMAYCNPCLVLTNEKPNKNKNLFEEAEKLDILVKDKNGTTYMIPNTAFDVGMLDSTHPNASGWFKTILLEMVDSGIRGLMADLVKGCL